MPPMTTQLSRTRSSTPNGRRAPSPQPAGPRTPSPLPAGGATYRVFVQEGASKMKYSSATLKRFAGMCDRSNYGVSGGYVRAAFQRVEKNRQFVMTMARMSDKTFVAFAKCSMYTAVPGVDFLRVVVIDVICADPRERGAGQVLLKELEGYAATRLNANLLLLDALVEQDTMRSYLRAGFQRGMGTRSIAAVARATSRYATALAQDAAFAQAPADWRNALGGEYFARNAPGETVVMFKVVPPVMASEIELDRVKWRNASVGARAGARGGVKQEVSGVFRRNNTVARGTYVRNATGWLRRV